MTAAFIDKYVSQWRRTVAEFHENLLRSLLPREMEVNEAAEYLKKNHVQFVIFPDGRQELHGFGQKLGDVFCGAEPDDPKNGIHLVARFTPVAKCMALWN